MNTQIITTLSAEELRQIIREELQRVNTKQEDKESQIMTIIDVCKYLDLSKSYIYKLTSLKAIPHYKRGKKLYFKKQEINNWLLEKKVSTMDELLDEHLNKIRGHK